MRSLFQILLGIASLVSFTPHAGAADSNVQVVVYKGPKECSDEDKILPGNYISIHFNGYIDESSNAGDRGTKFISSRDMNQTADFQIGKRNVIKGWDIGLLGLCKGSSVMFVTPPDLAYGQMGGGPGIPGGATLLFDIEVIDVHNCPPPSTTNPSLLQSKDGEGAEDGNLSEQECPASSAMSSLAYEGEEEAELEVATSFSASVRPQKGGKHNRRLKKKSKQKVQETITYLTSPAWCRNTGSKKRIELVQKIRESHNCNPRCWLPFKQCTQCCHDPDECKYDDWSIGWGGRCNCGPSPNVFCPPGYDITGGHVVCSRCDIDHINPRPGVPGFESIDVEGPVSSLRLGSGCRQGELCAGDSTTYCRLECKEHPFPEAFPRHCAVSGLNYCARSDDVCDDQRWEFLTIWGDFFLNFIPIPVGGQSVKALTRAAKTSKKYLDLNRALRKVGRAAVKQMRSKFKKELDSLKKDLKRALKDEVDAVIDGVIDDALEEMSLKASLEDQDDSELGDVVKAALGDFVVDLFTPFDFKRMQALMDGPDCARLSRISSKDLEWEDLPDGMENVAYHKKAKQSTTLRGGNANLAVDGNYDGDFKAGSVTHTTIHPNPWWEVNLEKLYTIDRINVYNREDCCGNRLAGLRVEIFNGNTVEWTSAPNDAIPDYENVFKVPPSTKGNKVRLSLPGKTQYLQLTEVEVIAK